MASDLVGKQVSIYEVNTEIPVETRDRARRVVADHSLRLLGEGWVYDKRTGWRDAVDDCGLLLDMLGLR